MKIKDFINEGDAQIQVACCCTNTGLSGVYLTNSGQVCREEFGFVEDCCFDEGDIMPNGERYRTLELNTRNWNTIKRLQKALVNYQN
ncbi:hypothetical protein LCGC14_1519870 [marine sediment metagenome]|uniref:Uncharacterized protein n=1 Tax=marine sediment metagenome TaxID=412755 RepID=A0A0F9IZ53_9ZZZZ